MQSPRPAPGGSQSRFWEEDSAPLPTSGLLRPRFLRLFWVTMTPFHGTEGRSLSCHRELTSPGGNSDENVHGRIPTVSKERIKFRFSFHGAVELTVINYFIISFPFDLPTGVCSKYTEIVKGPLDPDPVQTEFQETNPVTGFAPCGTKL